MCTRWSAENPKTGWLAHACQFFGWWWFRAVFRSFFGAPAPAMTSWLFCKEKWPRNTPENVTKWPADGPKKGPKTAWFFGQFWPVFRLFSNTPAAAKTSWPARWKPEEQLATAHVPTGDFNKCSIREHLLKFKPKDDQLSFNLSSFLPLGPQKIYEK